MLQLLKEYDWKNSYKKICVPYFFFLENNISSKLIKIGEGHLAFLVSVHVIYFEIYILTYMEVKLFNSKNWVTP